MLLVFALCVSSCSATKKTPIEISADVEIPESQSENSGDIGFLSGYWRGSSACETSVSDNSTRTYPITLSLKHLGGENYLGEMEIKGIAANGGVFIQLQNMEIEINSVHGNYNLAASTVLPFLRKEVDINLDRKIGIVSLGFYTVQRCQNFVLVRSRR